MCIPDREWEVTNSMTTTNAEPLTEAEIAELRSLYDPAWLVPSERWFATIDRLQSELAAERKRAAQFSDVAAELERAVRKFPTWPTDPLHAFAVLGEEFGELQKAILQHTYEPHKSTADDVRTEAIQAAAMAMRFLFSLDRYEYAHCQQHAQKEIA